MNHKKSLAALALAAAGLASPAFSADVGVSISIGQPGFYGQIDIGNVGRPAVLYPQPVIVERRYRDLAPIYLRVPPGHAKNWRRYCDRYDACYRPVYFVRDDWYQNIYVPRYREAHGGGYERREGRREEYREERRDDRRDFRRDERRRGDHDNGRGRGHDRD